jgi:hypothetical protein
MKTRLTRSLLTTSCFLLASCSTDLVAPPGTERAATLSFGPTVQIGDIEANPSTPFLRYAPDGRLFAIWTEDEPGQEIQPRHSSAHQHSGKMAPSPLRNALLAASSDGGKTWSSPQMVNSVKEAVQGEENGPKIAFGADNRAYVVWSIPGERGDKTRANIRFAMRDGKGGFTPPRTLNEVKDAGRFPMIDVAPDGNLLIAWIDRRVDQPHPRQLYLMRMNPDGQALTKNYKVGEGLCECCKLGIAFADDAGKTVYLVDREVDGQKIRNHVLRKSTDGGATFGAPVLISDDGWQVPSCPHSGPSLGRDPRGQLHVTWFTLGRSEQEAGIYYSFSKDDGKSFAARQLVHANTAPEVLYNNLVVGEDGTTYLAWTNLDHDKRVQIYMRSRAADGTWTSIQQLSNAKGNAGRPAMALRKNQLHVAWTETDGEESRVVLRNATLAR